MEQWYKNILIKRNISIGNKIKTEIKKEVKEYKPLMLCRREIGTLNDKLV